MGFSETVEALKNQYTDKYVKVDAARPELARFRDVVGQVKTVNMNGRALVEFLDYHLNTGWFDIDLSCLTVVDKPEPKAAAEKHAEPKPAAKPAAAKPAAAAAGEKKLSPLELARMQGAGAKAAPATPGGETAPAKKSTSDILAAARGGAGAAPAAKPASGEGKPAGAKPSTADILAAARGGKPAAAAPAAPTPASPKAEAPAAPKPAPAPAAAEPASAGGIVRVDKSSMTVQQMIDYCRAKDGK